MSVGGMTAGCGYSVGINFGKDIEIMNRVIFYKTATCPSCGKVVTFAMDEKAMKPGNEVKAIIVKEVAR